MLIFLLIVVALGLGLFFFNLMKELKEPSEAVSVVPINAPQKVSDEFIELKALYAAASQKVSMLEKLLEEKNGEILRLKKDSTSSDEHNAQVESLKGILQGQIETLKEQRRADKEELAQALEENMALQAKVFLHDTRQGAIEPSVKVTYVEPPALLQDVFSSDKDSLKSKE